MSGKVTMSVMSGHSGEEGRPYTEGGGSTIIGQRSSRGYCCTSAHCKDVKRTHQHTRPLQLSQLLAHPSLGGPFCDRYYFASDIPQAQRANAQAMEANLIVKKYYLKSKATTCHHCNKKGVLKVQAGTDVGLATKLMALATSSKKEIQRFVVIAGDGDFRDAYQYLKEELRK